MHLMPVWRKLTGVAHTLPHDLALTVPRQQGRPLEPGYYDTITAPTAVIAGGKSPAYMRNAQALIAAAVPGGQFDEVPGQTHMVKAKVLGPVFARYLADCVRTPGESARGVSQGRREPRPSVGVSRRTTGPSTGCSSE
jgi:hypothetical protein